MRITATVQRLRHADGLSHVRALAYQSAFVMMSGFIGIVGLSTVLGFEQLRGAVQELSTRFLPGEAGRLLQEAMQRGSSEASTAAIVGLGAALFSGTLAMMQLERSADRLHGIEHDPPLLSRLARAVALALSAGVMLALAGLVIGGGRSLATGAGLHGTVATVWEWGRWPLGLALAAVAIGLIVRFTSPERPATRDVVVGAALAVIGWVTFTALLGIYLSIGSESQSAYGPLLSVIAMLLWSAASSLALHLGLALVAERRSPAEPTVAKADELPASVRSGASG